MIVFIISLFVVEGLVSFVVVFVIMFGVNVGIMLIV